MAAPGGEWEAALRCVGDTSEEMNNYLLVKHCNATFGNAPLPVGRVVVGLQVYPFAAEDSERSVLGQGVAYLREKLGGQLRVIPNEEKPLTQYVRPVKGQFVRLVNSDLVDRTCALPPP